MRVETVNFSLCRAQSDAHLAFQPGNTVCVPWGRGIGKSFFARTLQYLLVAEWDRRKRVAIPHLDVTAAPFDFVRIVLLMPTLKQAKRVHAAPMTAELATSGQWGFLGGSFNKQDHRVTFPGGSWIQWVSAENANDNRGIRCDAVFVDEADDIDPDVYHAIVKPWFSEPFSLRHTLIGGTPRRGRHGLLWQAHSTLPKQDPSYKSFHATAYDAPDLVRPGVVDDAKRTAPPTTFAREWLADFDAAEGLVYPHFDEAFHVRTPPPLDSFRCFIVGVDHGWEDPGVIILIGVHGSGADETYWLLEEIVEQHRTEDWWIDKAKEVVVAHPSAQWYPDPANPARNRAYAVKAHARVVWKSTDSKGPAPVPTAATVNNVEDGVATVANALVIHDTDKEISPGVFAPKRAHLYVSPKCIRTIAEFGMYRRKRDSRNSEVVLDEVDSSHDDHTMDAIRYAIHTFRLGRTPSRRSELSDSDFSTG